MRTHTQFLSLILLSSAICLGLLLGACGTTQTPEGTTPTPSAEYPYPYVMP